MVRLNDHMKLSASLQLVGRYIISFIFVVFTQFAISLVPRFFPSSPFFIQLTLLGKFVYIYTCFKFNVVFFFWNFSFAALVLLVVVGFGRWSRWILRVYASAPAIVFFNILFIWTVYVAIIRQGACMFLNFSGFFYFTLRLKFKINW